MKHIQLTTPYDPGDLDVVTYTHVCVMTIALKPTSAILTVNYGTIPASSFIEGKTEPQRIIVDDADFTTLSAMLSNTDEESVAAFRRSCCQFLVDSGAFPGTVV